MSRLDVVNDVFERWWPTERLFEALPTFMNCIFFTHVQNCCSYKFLFLLHRNIALLNPDSKEGLYTHLNNDYSHGWTAQPNIELNISSFDCKNCKQRTFPCYTYNIQNDQLFLKYLGFNRRTLKIMGGKIAWFMYHWFSSGILFVVWIFRFLNEQELHIWAM